MEIEVPKVEIPAKIKTSPTKSDMKEKEEQESEDVKSEDENKEEEVSIPKAKSPGKRKVAPARAAKKPKQNEKETEKVETADVAGEEVAEEAPNFDFKATEDTDGMKKSVIIEHCKQCNSFKTRALKVQDSLKAAITSLKVSINPEKPRKGCFEIRDSEGNIFISLQDMPRPFTKLKALDLGQTAADIVAKLT